MTHDSRLQQSCSDPCLYYLVSDDLIVFISTHVDDYVIGSSSDLWYDQFIAAFGARFEITDMGVVEYSEIVVTLCDCNKEIYRGSKLICISKYTIQ